MLNVVSYSPVRAQRSGEPTTSRSATLDLLLTLFQTPCQLFVAGRFLVSQTLPPARQPVQGFMKVDSSRRKLFFSAF
jgi:hypothetical protein